MSEDEILHYWNVILVTRRKGLPQEKVYFHSKKFCEMESMSSQKKKTSRQKEEFTYIWNNFLSQEEIIQHSTRMSFVVSWKHILSQEETSCHRKERLHCFKTKLSAKGWKFLSLKGISCHTVEYFLSCSNRVTNILW